MTNLINFELVSPEEKLVSAPMYMVEVPGDDGSFGVMAGHCSIVSSLRTGVVRLHKDESNSDVREIFIVGGFADVTAQNCTILAEGAVDVKDLDKGALEKDLVNFAEDLTLAVEADDKLRVENKIALTKAKLQAVA